MILQPYAITPQLNRCFSCKSSEEIGIKPADHSLGSHKVNIYIGIHLERERERKRESTDFIFVRSGNAKVDQLRLLSELRMFIFFTFYSGEALV